MQLNIKIERVFLIFGDIYLKMMKRLSQRLITHIKLKRWNFLF